MKTRRNTEKAARPFATTRAKPRGCFANGDKAQTAFEAAWMREPVAARLHSRVLALQRRLQKAADHRVWRLYLALEEASNQRQARLFDFAHFFWRATERNCHGIRRAPSRG